MENFMSKIVFKLREDKIDKQGLVPIFANVEINGKRFTKSIGHKIKPSHWLKSEEVREPQKGHKVPYDFREINDLITWYKVNWKLLINNRSKRNITPQMVTDFLERRSEPKKVELWGPGFFEAFEEYLSYNQTKRMKPWRPNTVRNKTTVLNILKEWQKETGTEINFQNINKKIYDAIIEWCNEKKYSLNTQAKIIVTMKAFLEWCSDEDRNYYSGIAHKKFKAVTNDITLIYLTKEEFFAVYDLELTSKPLQKARDIFCFGCLTGQRVSDLMNLKHEHIVGDYWYLTTNKTETQHSIPLDPKAKAIINRYQHPVYVLPRLSQSGKSGLNKSIKKICRIAGITSKLAIITYPGGVRKETIFEKCDKITMHVARKTYATIMLSENVQTKIIRSGTGHKKDSVFDKYALAVNELKQSETERAFQRPRKKLPEGEPLSVEKPDEQLRELILEGVELRIFEDGGSYVVYCPLLDLTGNGKTEEEAKASFRIILEEHIRSINEKTESLSFANKEIFT